MTERETTATVGGGESIPEGRVSSVSEDVDDAAAATLAEAHEAIGSGKERVVSTAPDILTGVEAGPTLTHQDRPCGDCLAVEALDAEALGAGVPPVAC